MLLVEFPLVRVDQGGSVFVEQCIRTERGWVPTETLFSAYPTRRAPVDLTRLLRKQQAALRPIRES